jgi:hypothetical protein
LKLLATTHPAGDWRNTQVHRKALTLYFVVIHTIMKRQNSNQGACPSIFVVIDTNMV